MRRLLVLACLAAVVAAFVGFVDGGWGFLPGVVIGNVYGVASGMLLARRPS